MLDLENPLPCRNLLLVFLMKRGRLSGLGVLKIGISMEFCYTLYFGLIRKFLYRQIVELIAEYQIRSSLV